MRRRFVSFVSRWPPTNLTIFLSAATKKGVICLVRRGGRLVDKLSFPALQLTCTSALSRPGYLGRLTTFDPFLTTSPSSRFGISYFFAFWGLASLFKTTSCSFCCYTRVSPGSFRVFTLRLLKNTKARFRRRTFHEPNLIRLKADQNYLDRLNWFNWFRRRS